MKLPQNIDGIHRKGGSDSLTFSGIEASGIWSTIKNVAETVGDIAWDNKCLSCYAISNPIAALACRQACKRI
jgi:NAD-dependent SIR2 family protein deacetylase